MVVYSKYHPSGSILVYYDPVIASANPIHSDVVDVSFGVQKIQYTLN